MSSWQEYKKKKKQYAKDVITLNSSAVKVNNSNMSSWQKFKQEKEEKKTQSSTIVRNKDSEPQNTIWEDVGNFVDGTGKVVNNLWQGLKSGVMSLQQTVGRAANNTQADHADLINDMHKKVLEGRLKNNPEEAEQISRAINNPLISGDTIIEESQEYYNKIQQKKDENTLKIQENTESINNPIGKYIAGEIGPRYRTNVTRYGWWSSWNNLFYWFCNWKLL